MKTKKGNIMTLNQFKDKHYGKKELPNVTNLKQVTRTLKLELYSMKQDLKKD